MNAIDRAGVLALYPVLAALPGEELDRLCQPPTLLRLPAGSALFAEGQPCQGFPLLVAGSIKVVKSAPNGRELLLYRVEPGGSCIITSSCLVGQAPYTARGVAETALTLLVLPAAIFNRLLASDAAFRAFVFHLFAERLAHLMQLVEEVAFHRLDQRLARLLATRLPADGATLHATHQALAEELGSVREIVSRLLKNFEAQGLLRLGREQITLTDRTGLLRAAQAG